MGRILHHHGARGDLRQFVGILKTQPMVWAAYRADLMTLATVTNNKRAYPGTEWTSRKNKDGTFTLFGRWVGT